MHGTATGLRGVAAVGGVGVVAAAGEARCRDDDDEPHRAHGHAPRDERLGKVQGEVLDLRPCKWV